MGTRISGAVLKNTGYDYGINQFANTRLMDLRDDDEVTGTTQAAWNLGDRVCDWAIYGHGLVNRMSRCLPRGLQAIHRSETMTE